MKRYLSFFLAGLLGLLSIPGVFAQQQYRTEKDLLGEKQIPADAYYGIQTARALENFQLSGVLINHYAGFVEAWAIVKLAAARANADVGAMNKEKLAAIEKACQAVLNGSGSIPAPARTTWPAKSGAGASISVRTSRSAKKMLSNSSWFTARASRTT